MERNVRETLFAQRVLVFPNGRRKVATLLVHHDHQQVVLRVQSIAPRLIEKKAELKGHPASSREKKIAGGNPNVINLSG